MSFGTVNEKREGWRQIRSARIEPPQLCNPTEVWSSFESIIQLDLIFLRLRGGARRRWERKSTRERNFRLFVVAREGGE